MALKPVTTLETARLHIRPVVADDLPALHAINGDADVTRYLPYATWQTLQDGQSWLARMQALADAGTGQQLVLVDRATGTVVGTLLLFKHDEGSARLELGYVLGQAHWRQGLMAEAVRAVCGHAFSALGIRRIEAEVNPANQSSCRLLEAVGFTPEGLARQRWVAKGVAYDTRLYGLLASDWPQRPEVG